MNRQENLNGTTVLNHQSFKRHHISFMKKLLNRSQQQLSNVYQRFIKQ